MKVNFKLMNDGVLPQCMHKGDACLDAYSAENLTIGKGERVLVRLGFAVSVPEGYEMQVRGRSGLAKKGIDVSLGTVDSNYRGEVKANVINNSKEDFIVQFGDRICQLAIRKTEEIELYTVDELDETDRGEKGFGSSGV